MHLVPSHSAVPETKTHQPWGNRKTTKVNKVVPEPPRGYFPQTINFNSSQDEN